MGSSTWNWVRAKIEAYAEQRVRHLVKLNNTLATINLTVRQGWEREVAQLRPERDALKDDWGKLSSDFRLEREARERAEKALRELLPFVERHRVNMQPCVKCDHESCELVRRALAVLKSSTEGK